MAVSFPLAGQLYILFEEFWPLEEEEDNSIFETTWRHFLQRLGDFFIRNQLTHNWLLLYMLMSCKFSSCNLGVHNTPAANACDGVRQYIEINRGREKSNSIKQVLNLIPDI